MSIPVDLADLSAEIEKIGRDALLVTVPDAGPPHVASVIVTADGTRLSMGAGRKTRANASARASVTLVWPDADDAHCLIVDGTALGAHDEILTVQPTAAVLHRRAEA